MEKEVTIVISGQRPRGSPCGIVPDDRRRVVRASRQD
jgi:hypothetical protein